MAITLTENAIDRAKEFLNNRGKGVGIRLGIKTTGCSGLSYVIEFADTINSEDQIFEQDGIKIIIDPKCMIYLDGSELDYTKEGLNEGFKFTNPNEKARCGCGESFST
mgnify:FL=1|tara:strand:+ start:130 stop:453 length:324 start_codon:yes stop_codon:yes gene_type:complete